MKVKCPKCKEKYEVKPYEIRNDELCPSCVNTLPLEKEEKANSNVNSKVHSRLPLKTTATLQIVFCMVIGLIALFPIGDSLLRGERIGLSAFGFSSLIIYLGSVILKKRTWAGWSFCFVALYLFIADFLFIPFGFSSDFLEN